jgi:hypothetical protein
VAGLPVVDLVLLRNLAPDLPVRVGDILPARVISRQGPQGMLFLAGTQVPAQLPPELTAGMRMRVRVQEAGTDQLTLRVVPQSLEPEAGQHVPATPPPTADPLAGALRAGLAVGLPGGAIARLFVDPEAEGGRAAGRSGPTRVTLRYEAAAMGRVDLTLELLPGAVTGTVHAPSGAVAERLREGVAQLREALAAATARPASVTVRERGETVDLHA